MGFTDSSRHHVWAQLVVGVIQLCVTITRCGCLQPLVVELELTVSRTRKRVTINLPSGLRGWQTPSTYLRCGGNRFSSALALRTQWHTPVKPKASTAECEVCGDQEGSGMVITTQCRVADVAGDRYQVDCSSNCSDCI